MLTGVEHYRYLQKFLGLYLPLLHVVAMNINCYFPFVILLVTGKLMIMYTYNLT